MPPLRYSMVKEFKDFLIESLIPLSPSTHTFIYFMYTSRAHKNKIVQEEEFMYCVYCCQLNKRHGNNIYNIFILYI